MFVFATSNPLRFNHCLCMLALLFTYACYFNSVLAAPSPEKGRAEIDDHICEDPCDCGGGSGGGPGGGPGGGGGGPGGPGGGPDGDGGGMFGPDRFPKFGSQFGNWFSSDPLTGGFKRPGAAGAGGNTSMLPLAPTENLVLGRQNMVTAPVAMSNGELHYGRVDMVVPFENTSIQFYRRYDFFSWEAGDFGPGWRFGSESGIYYDNSSQEISVRLGSAATAEGDGFEPVKEEIIFEEISTDVWAPIDGFERYSLEFEEDPNTPQVWDTYSLIDRNGYKHVFRTQHANFKVANGSGSLHQEMNRFGAGVEYEYSTPGIYPVLSAIYSLDAPSTSIVSITRDSADRITSISNDIVGNAVDYTYDSDGYLIEVKDSCGCSSALPTERYSYDSTLSTGVLAYLDEILDGVNDTVYEFEWSSGAGESKVISISRALDTGKTAVTEFDYTHSGSGVYYDSSTTVHRVTDPIGTTFDFEFVSGKLVKKTITMDATSNPVDTIVHEFEWHPDHGRLTRVRRPDTYDLTYTYNDTTGAVTTVSMEDRQITYEYNGPLNQKSKMTDANGNVTTYEYFTVGNGANLYRVNHPHGTFEEYDWYADGRIKKYINGAGEITHYKYETVSGTFTESSRVQIGTDDTWSGGGDDLTTKREFDDEMRVTKITTPEGRITTYDYDNRGKLVKMDPPHSAPTLYDYDALGNMTSRGIDLDDDGTLDIDEPEWTMTYGPTGLLLDETDAVGLTTTYAYDLAGRLVRWTSPDSTLVEYKRDALGRITTVKDGFVSGGVVTTKILETREYDGAGRVTDIYDALNYHTRHLYDSYGDRTKTVDAIGHYSEFTYDDNGNQLTMVQFDKDSNDEVTSRLITYDQRNRIIEDRWLHDPVAGTKNDTLDAVTETSYDGVNRIIEQTVYTASGKGKTTDYFFDDAGRLDKVTDPDNYDTNYDYDGDGNRTKITNARGYDTIFEYGTATGLLDEVTDPLGHSSLMRYDSRGRLIEEEQWDGAVSGAPLAETIHYYDEVDRKIEARRTASPATGAYNTSQSAAANDEIAITTYDITTGQMIGSEIDCLGDCETTFTYDSYGRSLRTTQPDGSYTENSYDDNNRITNVVRVEKVSGSTDRTYETDYQLDDLGRIDMVTNQGADGVTSTSDDQVVSYVFDAAGRQTRMTDEAGRVTKTDYDALNRRTKVTEDFGGADERVTEFTYFRDGQLKTIVANNITANGGNQTTSYTYNDRGLPVTATYPVTGTVTMVYDEVGNMTERSDEAGVRVIYSYDRNDRLTTRNEVGQTTATERFTYDGMSRLKKAQYGTTSNADAYSESVFTWDSLSHLESEDQTLFEGTTRAVEFDYDIAGNQTQIVHPDGTTTINFEHDDRHRVTDIKIGSDTLAEYVWLGSVPHSRTVTTSYPHTTKPQIKTAWDRDGLMRVTQISNDLVVSDQATSGYADLGTFSYTYDAASNPLTETQTGSTWLDADRTFGYDRLNRVVESDHTRTQSWSTATTKVENFEYDDLGNRVSVSDGEAFWISSYEGTYEHNAANQATKITPALVQFGMNFDQTYDAAGNLTQTADVYPGFIGFHHTYDHLNRLVEVRREDSMGDLVAEYKYDALGRRIYFHDVVNDEERYYYYDGVNEIVEYDSPSGGNRLRYYVHGAAYIDERLSMYDDDSERPYYYTLNRMFNAMALIDRAGAIVERYAYDTYGQPLVRESAGRGDMDGDGVIETVADGDRVDDAVGFTTIWDPRADLDDDGDVDATDVALFDNKVELWDGDGTADATVAQVFSDVGNPFMFQGRPRFAIDTDLYGNDGASLDNFGINGDIDGDYAVLGVQAHDDGGTDAGTVYVYHHNGSQWVLDQELASDDLTAQDAFGSSVAIDGDTIVVGASLEDINGSSSGSAYVFVRQTSGWIQQAKLDASDGGAGHHFGSAVGIDGDTIVVGSRFWQDGGSGSSAGAAYVFRRTSGSWSEEQILEASDQAAGDWFGYSVGIDGERLVIGARMADPSSAIDAGKAYVFDFDSGLGTWGETQILTASDIDASAQFGVAVTISGDRVAVGARNADDGATADTGAVYIFEKDEGGTNNWGQTDKILPSVSGTGDGFEEPRLSGDRLVVGAWGDDDQGGQAGAAYVFDYNSGSSNWTQTKKITASDAAASDFFSVRGLDGDRLLCGSAWNDDDGSGSGSVYIFDKDIGGTNNWGETQSFVAQEDLKPSLAVLSLGCHRARFLDHMVGRWMSEDVYKDGFNYYQAYSSNPITNVDPTGFYSIGLDGKPAPNGNKVFVCCRDTEISVCVDGVFSLYGYRHCWLKTSITEAGLGQPGGDGNVEEGHSPLAQPTEIVDHSGQSTRKDVKVECQLLPDCPEDCVNKMLSIGKACGNWGPSNNCNTLVSNILSACGCTNPCIKWSAPKLTGGIEGWAMVRVCLQRKYPTDLSIPSGPDYIGPFPPQILVPPTGPEPTYVSYPPSPPSPPPPPNPAPTCFVGETLIATPRGYVEIKNLGVGDYVVSLDVSTGTIRSCRVTAIKCASTDQLISIDVGSQRILVTSEHPFLVKEKGWVKASRLTIGDSLTSVKLESIEVDSIDSLNNVDVWVYTLSVDDLHNFLVTDLDIVVHNKPP